MEDTIKEKLENFLHGKYLLKNLRKLISGGRKSLVIDFDQLLKFDMDLARTLLGNPNDFFDSADSILVEITKLPGMHLRVHGLDHTIKIRDIRAGHVSKFVQVEGIITRAGEVRPEVKEAVFECLRCGEENKVLQVDEVLRQPLACANPTCSKKGPFKLLVESSEFRDWQTIRVQECFEELRGGRMPQQLDGIIRDDLVDVAIPGNHVILTGTLELLQETLRGQPKRKRRVFRKILFVNHIEILQKGVEEAELKPEDEERIKELVKSPWFRDEIISSIAPSIFGYEPVKEAIALQLFGCPAVELSDGTRIRGDSHVLLTGDPAVAKSQIIKWVSQVAPRGLYTSGAKVTGPGLTASAVRDEIGGGWALEAGALVIADGGVACIDEFDKMSQEDRGAILEALEQQTVSVAKAGIVATLNSRTAVLAAANPVFGRFDPYKSLAEQINLPPLILSRFDLTFIMRDQPRAELDSDMATHILELHRVSPKIKAPKFDTETLRKIIIYARKHVRPKFEDKEALKVIREYYVNWRSLAERGELPLPITPRQLESLIRLAKANARMRLSDEVKIEDAKNAMRLVTLFLKEAGIDPETGKVDIDVLMTGKTQSQRQKLDRVLEIIKQLELDYEGVAPIEEVKRLATEEDIKESFVREMIDKEKMRGHLYEPKPGMISRVVK